MAAVRALRDRLWARLQSAFGTGVVRNGDAQHCLPNTLSVSFAGKVGAEILAAIDGVVASTGSACHADWIEPVPGPPEHRTDRGCPRSRGAREADVTNS